MRRSSFVPDAPPAHFNKQTLRTLLPYLQDYRGRILLALACLVAAKIASVGLPFILKHLVDALDKSSQAQGS
ncbi:MAG: metal ABC transporter permease, partial [Aeromonadales bacterium]|nr:metal ABC transporter permease [Aeromonadales bacterium]